MRNQRGLAGHGIAAAIVRVEQLFFVHLLPFEILRRRIIRFGVD